MIDFRYHIYSLAAVFLALAIGIVIGTSFATISPATDTEKHTIQSYENTMRILKREIEKATEKASAKNKMAQNNEDFCRAAQPIIVKGKLAWRNVAIIQTGDYDNLSGSIKHVLECSGARVTSISNISRTFPFDDSKKISQALTQCGVVPTGDGKQVRSKLFAVIAQALFSTDQSHIIPKLEDAGIGTFTGDYSRFNKLVVLVGGSEPNSPNRAQNVDVQLIAQFEKLGITVVGCEGLNAESSYIPAWHKTGIATVDNADSAIGQVALICALNGEMANFGVKETADRLIPLNLESH